MLVLSRKRGEGIVIDGKVLIRVLEMEDGRVRLGIEAPREMEIVREEIYLQIEEANAQAMGIKPEKLQSTLDEVQKLLKK